MPFDYSYVTGATGDWERGDSWVFIGACDLPLIISTGQEYHPSLFPSETYGNVVSLRSDASVYESIQSAVNLSIESGGRAGTRPNNLSISFNSSGLFLSGHSWSGHASPELLQWPSSGHLGMKTRVSISNLSTVASVLVGRVWVGDTYCIKILTQSGSTQTGEILSSDYTSVKVLGSGELVHGFVARQERGIVRIRATGLFGSGTFFSGDENVVSVFGDSELVHDIDGRGDASFPVCLVSGHLHFKINVPIILEYGL